MCHQGSDHPSVGDVEPRVGCIGEQILAKDHALLNGIAPAACRCTGGARAFTAHLKPYSGPDKPRARGTRPQGQGLTSSGARIRLWADRKERQKAADLLVRGTREVSW
jgi:hypothetical protein